MVASDFTPEAEIWPLCACAMKTNITLIYRWIAKIRQKSGSRNMMVTSDLRAEVER